MSILFYKQRHRNPNFKDTAGCELCTYPLHCHQAKGYEE